jgi:hypothetical protein
MIRKKEQKYNQRKNKTTLLTGTYYLVRYWVMLYNNIVGKNLKSIGESCD